MAILSRSSLSATPMTNHESSSLNTNRSITKSSLHIARGNTRINIHVQGTCIPECDREGEILTLENNRIGLRLM